MHNQDHVDFSLARIRALFEEASEAIEALRPGEKVAATVLAETIAVRHGMTGPALYPVLKFLFEGYPNRLVKRGAQGGIINPSPPAQDSAQEVKV